MRIDAKKFKAAIVAAELKRHEVATVAGLSVRRIFQLEVDGGEVNEHIVAAMAKRLNVKPGSLAP